MTICMSAVSGKGGAGKTTAVILLAGEYALEGKSVLLIDADGRQNLSTWFQRSIDKDNQPDGITLVTAAQDAGIRQILERDAARGGIPASGLPRKDQPTTLPSWKIGRYIAMTRPPTITPRITMMRGSSRLDIESTALSTSAS